MNRIWIALLAFLIVLLAACSPPPAAQGLNPLPTLSVTDIADLDIVSGQTVFVPAYSEIFFGSAENAMALTATLAIHNADPDDPIIVQSVRYYDTDGNLVREFVEQPTRLGPMATVGFVVAAGEVRGGWGTNFLVEWVADRPVYEPVVEAVMISNRGTEGVSFISEGRVVSEKRGDS